MKAEFEMTLEGRIPRLLITPETNAEKILLYMFRAKILSRLHGLHFGQEGPKWDPDGMHPRRAEPLPEGTIIMDAVEAEENVTIPGMYKFRHEPHLVLRAEHVLPIPPAKKEE